MATIKAIAATLEQLNQVILGKNHEVKLALACLLARGHLLIEDIPGMGKTTLSHALANSLGLSYRRIQFTSDLLPGDLLGVNIFNRNDGSFDFHPGPVFANVVLADEINRAPPKTQSALLEAMEELQVTVEGDTRPLPKPFFVIATQNPQEQAGTFALPESQLDRFMLRISLGYPAAEAEKQLLLGKDRRHLLTQLSSHLSAHVLTQVQNLVSEVHASDSVINYLYRLIDASRKDPARQHGLSPRAGMSLLQASKAWALIEGRKHLLPEDVQVVFPHVAEHRLSDGFHHPSNPLSEKILSTVDIL